ncbi:MAG TPA: hypothetical protein VM187_18875, partial [Niastella sp.]|nr:hypothetical protein [Niastella sp.]
MERPKAFYEKNSSQYIDDLTQLKPMATLVAALRLTCFLVFAWAIYKWIATHNTGWMVATVVLAVAFVILVRIAWRMNDRIALLQKLQFINNNELNVLHHQPNAFDHGAAFSSNDNNSGDLD